MKFGDVVFEGGGGGKGIFSGAIELAVLLSDLLLR